LVAVVILSPEEAAIAVSGGLPEPSYRPFRDSARGREWEREREQEWEREWERAEREERWEREQLGGLDGDEDSVVADSGADRFPGFPTDQSLPRIGAAERWNRYARESALLVVRRDNRFQIIAVGTVEGSSRAANRGVRRLEIRIRYVLWRSIPLDEVRAGLDARQQNLLDEQLSGELRPLSPKLGSSVLTVLMQRVPDLMPIFRTIQDQVNAEAIAQVRSRRSRPAVLVGEAVSSALHFFGARWHLLRPEPGPAPSAFALELEQLAGTVENDFITDDSVAFPGWERSAFSRGGWWEFRNKGRRLLVKNINVSPQENHTGADLVYVRRDPDAFVLVQYKLLQQLKGGRLVFRPDGRLDSQVTRMLSLENMPLGSVPADDIGTYRLGQGFSFVKFVLPAAARPERPGELVPGFYFPSEYIRRVLIKPDTGPQGGNVYFVSDHRHLSSETFARLVRDSWIGSTGDATALLRKTFSLRDSDADLVLAVDEPIEPVADVG
jgi:hypothetical protein